jgi:hypothetical protein
LGDDDEKDDEDGSKHLNLLSSDLMFQEDYKTSAAVISSSSQEVPLPMPPPPRSAVPASLPQASPPAIPANISITCGPSLPASSLHAHPALSVPAASSVPSASSASAVSASLPQAESPAASDNIQFSDEAQLIDLIKTVHLDNEVELLAENGIRRICDLTFLEDKDIEELELSRVSKMKLRKLLHQVKTMPTPIRVHVQCATNANMLQRLSATAMPLPPSVDIVIID